MLISGPGAKRAALALVIAGALLVAMGCMIKPGQASSELTYKFATTTSINAGEIIPGTDIRLQSVGEDGAHLVIGGQEALKRKGDSVDWEGTPIPGVNLDLDQRIVSYAGDELRLAGTAKIEIENADPRPVDISTSSPIKFSNPTVYSLAEGARIPGTTLVYEGETEEGAKLGSMEGYPYRKAGDSVFWEGSLRDGVYVRLNLRVVQYDARSLRLAGLVTLWIGP